MTAATVLTSLRTLVSSAQEQLIISRHLLATSRAALRRSSFTVLGPRRIRGGSALPIESDPAILAARLAAIVSSSDDAIVSKTLDGVITSWNAGAERMFGFTAAEAIGRHITMIIPKDRHAEEEQVLARLRRNERVDHFETIRMRKDGTLLDISLTVSPVLDSRGTVVGASKIARDISDRKAIERARAEVLAREQEARTAAEAANRVKDEFLAVLSHELRTPLNTAMGWAQLIDAGQLPAEEQRRGISAIRRGLAQQLRLINDLLDISAISAGKMQLVPVYVELVELVRLATEGWRAAAAAAKVEVATAFDGPVSVHGDPERLNQVFSNLVANALKFTPQGGRVSIDVGVRGSDGYIAVSDTGRGIEPQFLPHVFEKFRQAEVSTSRAVGGVGLGLAIVRSIVELHGGQVRADSEGIGKGATFTITLPLVSSAPD